MAGLLPRALFGAWLGTDSLNRRIEKGPRVRLFYAVDSRYRLPHESNSDCRTNRHAAQVKSHAIRVEEQGFCKRDPGFGLLRGVCREVITRPSRLGIFRLFLGAQTTPRESRAHRELLFTGRIAPQHEFAACHDECATKSRHKSLLAARVREGRAHEACVGDAFTG